MIRVADYLWRRIAQEDVKHVFMLSGGGAMHLNDALGRNQTLTSVCNHHEQACAMAAEGYARINGNLGVACVTTGPGGTNTLTGVLGQWLDSIPALYVSGQVRADVTVASTGLPLRQLGDQEADIVSIVKSITKYATMVTDPFSIRYHCERALHLARSGRPGPVWLDIPLNVQGTLVEEENLFPYHPAQDPVEFNLQLVESQVTEILERAKTAKRPLILAGSAIRSSGSYLRFQSMVQKLGIPVIVAWNAVDLMPSSHPLFMGRQGPLAQRGANFIFQNCDFLLSLGCRMSVARQVGYEYSSVLREAYTAMVNIDSFEMRKPTISIDLPVRCDVGVFLGLMERHLGDQLLPPRAEWISWCRERRDRYPAVLSAYREEKESVNPYVFCEALSHCLEEDEVVVSSDGAACVMPIQTLFLKEGQRYLVNSGCAAMGYGLLAAIGACFARDRGRIVCLEGDGSIQLNLQELQTVVHHRLPLKIFIFSNGGYLSIRTTQKTFFDGHLMGEGPKSGVSFPDIVKVAQAYGIPSARIHHHREMKEIIQRALDSAGPFLCDVRMSPDQSFVPRVSSQRLPDGRMVSKPLEDMYPFLDRKEFLENMLIPAWEKK